MNKIELRNYCREKIKETPLDCFHDWGKEMFKIVSVTPEWKNSSTIFLFVSTPDEVDTMPFLLAALGDRKTVCVPKITGCGKMDAVQIENISQLEKGRFGIFEPTADCVKVKKKKIDLIILPCFAADSTGKRLGKGGGYYDRYCEDIKCKKITLCPEMLLFDDGIIPTEKWDIRTDYIASEKRLIKAVTGNGDKKEI